MVALRELCPEVVEVLQLDQMPYIAERSGDDRRFSDGGRSGDTARHDW